MKKLQLLLPLLLLLASCSTSTTTTTSAPVAPEITSILEQHPDVYIQEDAVWERTLYSGTTEQHEFATELNSEETKAKMRYYNWVLEEDAANVIRFTKGDLRVSYTTKTTGFVLFIEPKDLYDSP